MKTLTNEQIAVINSKEAMKIIATEAKKALAAKFETTVGMIEQAYITGNANVHKMLAELITTGINECANLAKS